MQTSSNLHILIVEDLESDYELILESLNGIHNKVDPVRANSLTEFKEKVQTEHFDLLFLDLGLPESKGMDTIAKAHDILKNTSNSHISIIILTGIQDFAISKQALKEGVKDYLVKGEFGPVELQRAVSFATLRKENPPRLSALKFWK